MNNNAGTQVVKLIPARYAVAVEPFARRRSQSGGIPVKAGVNWIVTTTLYWCIKHLWLGWSHQEAQVF